MRQRCDNAFRAWQDGAIVCPCAWCARQQWCHVATCGSNPTERNVRFGCYASLATINLTRDELRLMAVRMVGDVTQEDFGDR